MKSVRPIWRHVIHRGMRGAFAAGVVAVLGAPSAASAQGAAGGVAPQEGARSPVQVTATDYARAEALIGWNARELVIDDAVTPRWTSGGRFWYRNRGTKGYEYLIVDGLTGAKRPLFDAVRLASELSERADTAYEAMKLPFRDITLSNDGKSIVFDVGKKRWWNCDIVAYKCTGPDSTPPSHANEVKSPDGKWVVYERGGNLFLREASGGAETALTTDGTPDYGYGLSNIGCCQQVTNVRSKTEIRPYVLWSADSKRFITHKWDQRNVRQMYLLETKNPGPILHSYRYALPGDSVIPKFDYYAFDLAARKATKVDVGPIDAVNTSCCWLSSDTTWKDVRWSNGSDEFLFTVGKRGFHELTLMVANAST
ncbi:MAG: DPP IV N-terminal domain-containing protein, partial [Gemmatimonadaceae bacterium]